MQIQEVQSRCQASREVEDPRKGHSLNHFGFRGNQLRSNDCKIVEYYGHRGSIFQHNMRFSGQQGPESLIIGAKDVPNADLGKK